MKVKISPYVHLPPESLELRSGYAGITGEEKKRKKRKKKKKKRKKKKKKKEKILKMKHYYSHPFSLFIKVSIWANIEGSGDTLFSQC